MNEFLNKVGAAFTPPRRKALYRIATVVALILVLHGVVTAQDAGEALAVLSYLLFGGVAHLAAAHVPKDGDR